MKLPKKTIAQIKNMWKTYKLGLLHGIAIVSCAYGLDESNSNRFAKVTNSKEVNKLIEKCESEWHEWALRQILMSTFPKSVVKQMIDSKKCLDEFVKFLNTIL